MNSKIVGVRFIHPNLLTPHHHAGKPLIPAMFLHENGRHYNA
jgi:hypothetical protein